MSQNIIPGTCRAYLEERRATRRTRRNISILLAVALCIAAYGLSVFADAILLIVGV
jgi:hypothetical protein